MQEKLDLTYNDAVQAIKQAILSSQLRAARHVNEEQLALYFGIGKYISENTREGKWGTGAVEIRHSQITKFDEATFALPLRYVAMFVAVLVMSIANVGMAWG